MMTFMEWLLDEGATQMLHKAFSPEVIAHYKSHIGFVMPAGKVKHSLRVGATVMKAGGNPKAAIFHDFLERGGSINTLTTQLGLDAQTIQIIKALSSDEKNTDSEDNQPLEHLKQVLSKPIDEKIKNQIILIKLSDRIDNLKRRLKAKGKIGTKYAAKSKELAEYLFREYTGNAEDILLLRKRLKNLGIEIKKYHRSWS